MFESKLIRYLNDISYFYIFFLLYHLNSSIFISYHPKIMLDFSYRQLCNSEEKYKVNSTPLKTVKDHPPVGFHCHTFTRPDQHVLLIITSKIKYTDYIHINEY